MAEVTIMRPAGLDALPESYGPLFDRAALTFAADDRVRGMWVHGALARGTADAGSDLDVCVAVRDSDFRQFAGQWRDWLTLASPAVPLRAVRRVQSAEATDRA